MGVRIPGTCWSVLAPQDIKVLSQNFATSYQLAPNRYFFAAYGGYLSRNGRTLSFEETLNNGLVPHNEPLARRAPQLFDRILDGQSHGVQQFLLAGSGWDTPIFYQESGTGCAELMADGDEVVPIRSADLGYPGAAHQGLIGEVADVAYVRDARHMLLMQEPAIWQQVLRWIDLVQGGTRP